MRSTRLWVIAKPRNAIDPITTLDMLVVTQFIPDEHGNESNAHHTCCKTSQVDKREDPVFLKNPKKQDKVMSHDYGMINTLSKNQTNAYFGMNERFLKFSLCGFDRKRSDADVSASFNFA